MTAQRKPKKCKACGTEFLPFQSFQKACSPACALELVTQDKVKAYNREARRRRKKLKTRSQWLKEAQGEFNRFIRLRDKDLPCISCGRTEAEIQHSDIGGAWDCGHYLSTGSHPELRFNEFNAHKQCKQCNRDKSGNHANYRKRLIAKIGINLVEWLECAHKPLKPTIDDLIWIKAHYRERAKEL